MWCFIFSLGLIGVSIFCMILVFFVYVIFINLLKMCCDELLELNLECVVGRCRLGFYM